MADIQSNIDININASGALASLQALQRQISLFQTSMAKGGEVSNAKLRDMQQNLVNNINATGQFTASIQRVKTTTESFTQALEKNKLSMGQYFRYAMGSTQTFGKSFRTEFDTIEKVARERVKTLQTQYIKLGRDANGAMQAIAVRPQVLDMKDLGTQTAIAAQKAQLFNQLMQQGSTNLLNFGKNTQWAGRQLMVGFTIPLGIMGAAAAREFQKIEEQVLRLERVYGDFTTTVADTEAATAQIKGLANEFTKYGIAVEKTIGLAADAAAMGQTGAALMAQVSEATRLAALGGVTQQQSLETTISLTSAFGVATEDLAKKTDFLNAVENQTVTSIADLTEAIPKAGPVIQQLGGNVEDLTFFLTAMREGGINASESANALKSGLASLINPTQEATDMLANFGINLQGIVEANKGNVRGIVVDFAKALDTLDPLNRAQAIEQLFGKFQFSRLSTLFQNVIAEGTQASRVLELTNASASELAALSERELGKIEASPLYQYQGAIERFKAAIAPVGEEFMKAVTPLINFGTQILDAFNGWSDGAKQFAVVAVGAVAGLGPILLMTFGLMANGLANIVKGVMFVKNGFRNLGGQSNVLTEQLSYMNSEQLQAAAVAGSLNQVHNSLIQTFTSEAGAVRNLATAYGQAIAAQGAFMGGTMVAGGRGGKGGAKKMARGGIVRGPGTGTSDSVPAMLSNGEAVIAAATVKKYPGLVSGLIAGEVRHLADSGIIEKQLGYTRQAGAPAANYGLAATHGMAPIQIGEEVAKGLAQGLSEGRVRDMLMRSVGEQGLYSDLVFGMPAAFNKEAMTGTQGAEFIRSNTGAFGSFLAKTHNIDTSSPEFTAFANRVADGLAAAGDNAIREGDFYQIVRSSIAETSESAVKRGLVDAGKTFSSVNVTGASGRQHREGLRTGQYFYGDQESMQLVDDPDYKGYRARRAGIRREYNELADNFVLEGANQLRDTQQARTEVNNLENKEIRQTKEYIKSRAKAEQLFEEERAKLAGAEKGKFTKNKQQWLDEQTLMLEEERKQKRRDRDARRKAETEAQQTALAVADQDTKKNKKTLKQRISGMAGRIGMAGMGISTGLMMAQGVGGPVGDIAGQLAGPAFAASGLLSVLQMFPGAMSAIISPAGLVVAGVAAVGAVLVGMYQRLEETRAKAKEAAEAVSVGSSAMEKYAQATGKVTATEQLRQKEASVTNKVMEEGEKTFGQSYLESETGQAVQSGFEKAIDTVGRSDAIDGLAQQLATAVTTNILTYDQATEIADALSKELEDKSIVLGVVGELQSLIGEDGKQLLDKPLDVRVRLIQESSKRVASDLKTLWNTSSSWMDPEGVTKSAEAEEAAAVNFAAMRQQSQLILDDLQLRHEARLEELRAAGDLVAVEKEIQAYNEMRLPIEKQTTEEFKKQLAELDKMEGKRRKPSAGGGTGFTGPERGAAQAIARSARESMVSAYAGTESEQAAKDVSSALAKPGMMMKSSAVLTLVTDIQAGTISPEDFLKLTDFMNPATNVKTYEKIALISAQLGGPAAADLQRLLPMIGDEKIAANIVANLDLGDPEEAKSLLDTYSKLQEMGGEGGIELISRSGIAGKAGDEARAQIAALTKDYEAIQAAYEAGGPITFEMLTSIDWAGVASMGELQAWFDSLPADQKKFFSEYFLSIYASLDQSEVESFLRETGVATGAQQASMAGFGGFYGAGGNANLGYSSAQLQQGRIDLAAKLARGMTNVMSSLGGSSGAGPSRLPGPPSGGGGGGGGGGGAQEPEKPPTSFLDDIVKDLRDFANATRTLTENFTDSLSAIRNTPTNIFSGLTQQLRKIGAGDDIIALMTGMSKQDWDQYKNEFFNFDASGNVTGFKQSLLDIQRQLRRITLGRFIDEQQRSLADLSQQSSAIAKLVSLGMSYAESYRLVEDAAVAAAIANAASAEEIRQIIALTRQLAQAQTIAQASSSLATGSEDVATSRKRLTAMQRFAGNLTDAQMTAVLANEELQTMLANFDQLDDTQLENLNQALLDVERQAEIEIQLKMLTPEGMSELFTEGFNKAMERFNAQQKEIEIDIRLRGAVDKEAIDSATDLIEDLRNAPGGLDDLEADLQRIQEQEIDINKKYEARFKALDEIQKANDRIAAQQRGQLSLAEALSQGDIAAAARAAEEIRATDAAQALVDQREALQKSQELELANLMGQMGLTREQLEARIREIKQQIFEIEEKTIEPAQRRLDILEREKLNRIENLTVLGQTRQQWEDTQNEIDLARTSSEQYEESISRAQELVQEVIDKWKGVPTEVTTIHTIIERRKQENTPPPAPTPPPTPAPAPAPAPAAPTNRGQYTVVRGDTLWGIAQRYYGNGNQWPKIYNANRGVIGGNPNLIYPGQVYTIPLAMGGMVPKYLANGGSAERVKLGDFHIPMRYVGGTVTYAQGGKVAPPNVKSPFRVGTDTVPAMLTPGEFVVRKWAVDKFGVENLQAINQGNYGSGSVYNYNMSVNVRSDANPDEIARTVIAQIKRVDSQRIRGNRF